MCTNEFGKCILFNLSSGKECLNCSYYKKDNLLSKNEVKILIKKIQKIEKKM